VVELPSPSSTPSQVRQSPFLRASKQLPEIILI
jgi:hypothetical protein